MRNKISKKRKITITNKDKIEFDTGRVPYHCTRKKQEQRLPSKQRMTRDYKTEGAPCRSILQRHPPTTTSQYCDGG